MRYSFRALLFATTITGIGFGYLNRASPTERIAEILHSDQTDAQKLDQLASYVSIGDTFDEVTERLMSQPSGRYPSYVSDLYSYDCGLELAFNSRRELYAIGYDVGDGTGYHDLVDDTSLGL